MQFRSIAARTGGYSTVQGCDFKHFVPRLRASPPKRSISAGVRDDPQLSRPQRHDAGSPGRGGGDAAGFADAGQPVLRP
ncbi:hypothetical protein BOS5A_201002 [Bosea sp. EC-HK365B]|nr:hypothetical protein BOS5A_201002 [Bosea sp. EC-HK365B]